MRLRRNSVAKDRRSERGVTLLEVGASLMILGAGSLGFVSLTISGQSLQKETEGKGKAIHMARQVIEEMAASPFKDLYKKYNANPDDDPDGVGQSLGSTFTRKEFSELTARQGSLPLLETDLELRARLKMPVTSSGDWLREDLADPDFGTIDLNGDGSIDSADHSMDYVLFPMKISVDWGENNSNNQVAFQIVLGKK